MSKNLKKSLQRYFRKIKTQHSHQLRLPSKKWISLKSCKHPRTPSFSIENKNNKDDEATLADIDQFLFENFKSLFLDEQEGAHPNKNTKCVVRSDEDEDKDQEKTNGKKSSNLGQIIFDSSEGGSPLNLNGSNRFFTPRGFSGSTTTSTTNTFEEMGSSSNSSTSKTFNVDSFSKKDKINIPNNCVVVLTSSPNPYDDFRKSMQENVEARIMKNQSVDWDFLEELLFCYINMNEKKSCKFILSAFCDLISVMRQSSDTEPETDPEKPRSVRTIRKGRDVRKKKNKELKL